MAKKLTFKRILAMILAIMMLTGIMQLTVFADEAVGAQEHEPSTALDPAPNYYQNEQLELGNTAVRTGPDTWEVNLKTTVGNIEIAQQPLEVVFVLDFSSSMLWCAETPEHRHSNSCYENQLTCGHEEHAHSAACYSEDPSCGFDEHVHSADCYGELTCGLDEHTHSAKPSANPTNAQIEANAVVGCWQAWGTWSGNHWSNKNRGWTLVCDSTEHTHSNDCRELRCELAEHTHSTDCFDLICGLEEHAHSNSCYTRVLVCGLEEHSHPYNSWTHMCEPCSNVDPDTLAGSRLDELNKALNAMVASLGDNAAIKFLTFNASGAATVRTASELIGKTTAELESMVRGGTYLGQAINTGVNKFQSESAEQIMVIVTDGESNDGYSTNTIDTFKSDEDHTVYTVSFTYTDPALDALASPGCAKKAGGDLSLGTVFDSITNEISAMVVDPLGSLVTSDLSSVHVSSPADGGVVSVDGNEIRWYPNNDQITSDAPLTMTYSVSLSDNANTDTAGKYTNVPLCNASYLQYALVVNGDRQPQVDAGFPTPVAKYEVATLTEAYKTTDDADITDKAPHAKQAVISDWKDADYSPEFTIYAAPTTIDSGNNANLKYVYAYSKYDGEQLDAYSADYQKDVFGDSDAHELVHYYTLEYVYTVRYEYNTPCPEDAPELPEAEDCVTGSTVPVATEPVMDDYNFSGWNTSDATVENDAFTMPQKDVTFYGSWTIKPSYQIFANYYTITDGGAPVLDNAAPRALTDVIYTNDESASYTLKEADYIYGEGGAYALKDGVSPTVAVTPDISTAKVTFELYRYVKSPAKYTVTHVYVDVDPDGNETENQSLRYTTAYTGKHGDEISAENTTQVPRDDKNGTYPFFMASPASVVLNKDVEQNIKLTYRHYQYRVTTSGDEGVEDLTATAVYNKGENAAVTYSIKDGYEIVTFTVDGAPAEDGPRTFNAIDANHSVAITTKKIDYKLFVEYIFSDGTTHDGFTDGYDNKAYHFDSAWAVEAKEAPAGYTFNADASTNPLSGENFGYGDKIVTLRYTKNGDATVTVKYVIDDGTETEIKTAYSQSGTIGTDYTIPETAKPASIEFGGKTYDFVSDDNAVYASTYTQGGTVITRRYAEREKFTVNVLYVSQADRTNVIGSQPEVTLYITETHTVTIPATYSPDGSSTWYVDAEDITISTPVNYTSAQFGADGTTAAITRYVDRNNVVDGVATVTVGFYQLPTWTIDATYTTITNGNSSTQTAGDHGTGEIGEKVPFNQADYDTKYDFSAENFNEDLKVNGEAVTEMPEMEKFGTYAVTLSYTKTVNNPVDTTIKHTFRTTLNGESIADNTKADDEVFAVTYGQTADMTTHSKAGQTGYEGYTVEAYDPASAQLAAGATGTIQYLREYVTVVFDMNGGTWNDSLNNVEYTVVKGDALATDQPVPAPTRDGYYFVGWDVDVEGATVDGTFTQKTTFTAKWSKVPAVDYTVTHVYLTNGTEDGRTTETFTGTEGETIAAADIKRVTEYAGNTYEFESATADIVLKSGEAKNITLTYTRTYTEPTPPPYYPPVDPTPTPDPDPDPDPDPTEIPEDDVPLSDTPTEIPEDDVPLSDTPVEIPEDDVPLGDQPGIPGFDNTPKTGDNAHYRFWVIVSLLSGLGLIVLGFDGRKRSRRTGR